MLWIIAFIFSFPHFSFSFYFHSFPSSLKFIKYINVLDHLLGIHSLHSSAASCCTNWRQCVFIMMPCFYIFSTFCAIMHIIWFFRLYNLSTVMDCIIKNLKTDTNWQSWFWLCRLILSCRLSRCLLAIYRAKMRLLIQNAVKDEVLQKEFGWCKRIDSDTRLCLLLL